MCDFAGISLKISPAKAPPTHSKITAASVCLMAASMSVQKDAESLLNAYFAP
jgi:hypothetical protein